jgi:hypothetical protein
VRARAGNTPQRIDDPPQAFDGGRIEVGSAGFGTRQQPT